MPYKKATKAELLQSDLEYVNLSLGMPWSTLILLIHFLLEEKHQILGKGEVSFNLCSSHQLELIL